jgi:glucosamine--fructose-6-phosphate aminotransferase (isomerizing)
MTRQPIIICNEDDRSFDENEMPVIRVPKTIDALQGVLNIVPLQLLSYHLACQKGFDVDFPSECLERNPFLCFDVSL